MILGLADVRPCEHVPVDSAKRPYRQSPFFSCEKAVASGLGCRIRLTSAPIRRGFPAASLGTRFLLGPDFAEVSRVVEYNSLKARNSVAPSFWGRRIAVAAGVPTSGSPSYSPDCGLEAGAGGTSCLGTCFPRSHQLGSANSSAALPAGFGIALSRNTQWGDTLGRCRKRQRLARGFRGRESTHLPACGRAVGAGESVGGDLPVRNAAVGTAPF